MNLRKKTLNNRLLHFCGVFHQFTFSENFLSIFKKILIKFRILHRANQAINSLRAGWPCGLSVQKFKSLGPSYRARCSRSLHQDQGFIFFLVDSQTVFKKTAETSTIIVIIVFLNSRYTASFLSRGRDRLDNPSSGHCH